MVDLKQSHDRLDRYLRQLRPDSVAFWLVCLAFALFGVAVISIREAPRLRAAIAGADGVATVVGRDCGRDAFEYEFTSPAGLTVRDRSSASRAGVMCEDLVVGGTIAVRYTRPAHVVGPAPMAFVRRRIFVMAGFGLVVVGLTAAVLMAFHESPRQRRRSGRR